MDEYMEALRKEYDGLGLSDRQMLVAKSNGITPEQIKKIREAYEVLDTTIRDIWEKIATAIRQTLGSNEFKNFIKASNANNRKDAKGKHLKPWEKNKFFN